VQGLDGADTERTIAVRRLAARPAELTARRKRFLRRPRVVIHYSRDSLRWLSRFAPALDDFDAAFMGWHAWLESAGARIDYIDDDGLIRLPDNEDDPLVLPLTSVAGDALVARLAAYRGLIVAGPHTALGDGCGHLRPNGLPAGLADRLGVTLGRWHDIGRLPTARGLPALKGYREVNAPRRRTNPVLSNGSPLLVRTDQAVVSAVDLGDLWMRGTAAQRKRLAAHVGLRLR
jgi:hypothetical protein